LESLRGLDGPFDLVFLDATKTEIDAYLAEVERMLDPRALLVVDNLLMGGDVALPDGADTRWGEDALRAARATTRALMASDEWLFSLLPVGDGVGLGARRGTVGT
jgi:predicted O-methyltransferase YrrM